MLFLYKNNFYSDNIIIVYYNFLEPPENEEIDEKAGKRNCTLKFFWSHKIKDKIGNIIKW